MKVRHRIQQLDVAPLALKTLNVLLQRLWHQPLAVHRYPDDIAEAVLDRAGAAGEGRQLYQTDVALVEERFAHVDQRARDAVRDREVVRADVQAFAPASLLSKPLAQSWVALMPTVAWLETVGIIFVILTCLRVWMGSNTTISSAYAQIPDGGMQRKLLLEEAKRSTEILQDIRRILDNETLKVRIEGADNTGTDNKRGR